MSGTNDADEQQQQRYHPPRTGKHQIPTISQYREEKEARQAAASSPGGNDSSKQSDANGHLEDHSQHGGQQEQQQSQEDRDAETVHDTSEADAGATDPRTQRKQQKKRKDERAEREVTDPVTHLPIRIHDLTSSALEAVPENEAPFGTTARTATGGSNKRKSLNELREEAEDLQTGHDAMRALFPPPEFQTVKEELTRINKLGITVGLVGTASIILLFVGIERLLNLSTLAQKASGRLGTSHSIMYAVFWTSLFAGAFAAITAIVLGVRQWVTKKISVLWEDEVWDANGEKTDAKAGGHETETVAWLNSLLGSVWPLINPDLFISLADTLEDVMQASLPKMVRMVSVNDIGQGSENVRILGIRWLPSAAAARSVDEQGKLEPEKDDKKNDRNVPGEGEIDQDKEKDNNRTQQGDDGSQQQVAEGLEAEEGDFVNVEVSFAYRARSSKASLKERAKDMHLYMAFYLPGNVKLPVWVDLRGIIGTMRLRLQLCPDPPFFSLCTLTFLGQPKVDLSCTPLSRHALNIMDVPLISNFVQSAVDAAMAQYVAPKSLNLDLKDLLAGDDFKKDVSARGVLVVNIKRGYDFKTGDAGIPLLKDGSSDPYVSVGWAKFGKPLWSTRMMPNEMEPYWNETAYVLVTPEELNVNERLRVQLWDSDRMTADDDLGRIEVDLKDLMRRDESNGKMWHRTDGFRALKKGDDMPGQLEWSVGYFSKVSIQDCQLQKQTVDPQIRTLKQLKEKVDSISERKLREANLKEGRHKKDADELQQQKAQEMKSYQDAMIISSPPPDGYPSGVFSIQIHQIMGLELEKVNKVDTEKAQEGNDEEEEGEGLPSAYCTVIINHSKVFKTRTKPKNSKPFYNASTERFISDWRNAEVYVSVRDARVKEDDPLLGIVHLPLSEMFEDRSQVNGFFPLTGGVGFGRVRLSMVWRSVQYLGEPNDLGWAYGTLEVKPTYSEIEVPKELQELKLRFHTDLGSGKMYPAKDGQGWSTKKDQSLKLPVHKRYSSCLAVEFRQKSMIHDNTQAFGILWLKDLVDEEEDEKTVTIWKGDFERAKMNAMPECGEKIGSIKLKLTFWSGLGAAHNKWASKDKNVGDVAEVLDCARDNDEEMQNEKEAGVIDGTDSDSSASEGDDNDNENTDNGDDDNGHVNGDNKQNAVGKVQNMKKHQDQLSRRNRGVMQWKAPRTAKWAAHKLERTEDKITGIFKHHTKGGEIESEA